MKFFGAVRCLPERSGGPDRPHRAHARPQARDRRYAAWRPRHHPRMGGQNANPPGRDGAGVSVSVVAGAHNRRSLSPPEGVAGTNSLRCLAPDGLFSITGLPAAKSRIAHLTRGGIALSRRSRSDLGIRAYAVSAIQIDAPAPVSFKRLSPTRVSPRGKGA